MTRPIDPDPTPPSHEQEDPDQAKRRERPDAIPPTTGRGYASGFADLDEEEEAERPPEKRDEP